MEKIMEKAMTNDTPTSPVQIVLEDNSADWAKVHTANDVVRGRVLVDARLKPSGATVCFSGKAVSQIQDMHAMVNTAQSVLFEYKTTLSASDECETDNNSSSSSSTHPVAFPFEFRFPSSVQNEGRNVKDNPAFTRQPGHPLPPSMGASVYALKQFINYGISAKAHVPQQQHRLFGRSNKGSQYIRFLPPCISSSRADRPILNRRTVTITRQSRRLDPEYTNTKTLRSKLKSILPSNASDPTATFSLQTTTPAALRAGTTITVILALSHKSRSPALPSPPELRLRGFRIGLKAHTHVRVPYNGPTQFFGDELMASDAHGIVLAERHWDNGAEAGVVLREGEELKLPELAKEGRVEVGRDVVPSFRTYGIARTYVLVVRLWIECAGKVYDVEASAFEVVVLSWVGDAMGDAEAGAGTGKAGGSRVVEGGMKKDRLGVEEHDEGSTSSRVPSDSVLRWNDADENDALPPPPYEDVTYIDHLVDKDRV